MSSETPIQSESAPRRSRSYLRYVANLIAVFMIVDFAAMLLGHDLLHTRHRYTSPSGNATLVLTEHSFFGCSYDVRLSHSFWEMPPVCGRIDPVADGACHPVSITWNAQESAAEWDIAYINQAGSIDLSSCY